MLQSLNNFDPIKFLSINTASLSEEDIEALRSKLKNKIGEYVLLTFSQYFEDDEFEKLTSLKNGQEILSRLNQAMPNMNTKLFEGLENFKRDYQAVHKGGRHA